MAVKISYRNILLVAVMGLLMISSSCKKEEIDPLQYYNQLAMMNNEVTYQLHLAMNAVKQYINTTFENPDDKRIHSLQLHIDSVSRLCKSYQDDMLKIGPYEGDSSLLKPFLGSLESMDSISQNELSLFVKGLKAAEANNQQIVYLYTASMKLAQDHQRILEAIMLFKQEYKLKFDPTAYEVSRIKTKRFTNNISFLNNSIVLAGDCVNGFGQLQSSDGTLYTGDFQDGLFNGFGKLEYPNGDSYLGHFRMGSFYGKGTYTWHNGMIYRGEWREDMFNGIGTLINPQGDSTFGYWVNGLRTRFNEASSLSGN